MSLTGLILAAGSGKRMNSDIPKVLHPVAGTPMLEWVIRALEGIPCEQICLVLSPKHSPYKDLLDKHREITACIQKEANGTAGAVAAAQSVFEGCAEVPYGTGVLLRGKKIKSKYLLICAGDTPALDVSILQNFIASCRSNAARIGVLGMRLPNPSGYGRLLLSKQGKLQCIVEEKDADEETKKIPLCNSGIIFAEAPYLFSLLKMVDNKNAQSEYYLTDCIQIASDEGENVDVFITDEWQTLSGINNREQLASVDTWFRENKVSVRK